MKHIIKLAVCLLAICFIACSGNKKKSDDTIARKDLRTDFNMNRSHQDTTMVLELAKNFLEALKSKDVEGALGQLYEVNGDSVNSPSAEELSALRKTYQSIPVIDYKVEEVYMYSDSDCEVRYSTVMFEKSDDNPMSNTTKGALHPYRVNGKWYLTIELRKNEMKPDGN